MEYLTNPDLSFHHDAPANWKGNPYDGKEFKYDRDPFRPDWSVLLKMIFTANPQRAEKKADTWTPEVSADVTYLEDRERDWIVWLGHACFLLQLNGIRFLIDPQLTDMPFVPRRVFPPFGYKDIRGVDYLLLSHDHRDHVDKKCIRAIVANNPIRKILCSLKLSQTIGDWVGKTPIEEAAWYQQFDTKEAGVKITFLPSRHWCRRGLTDFNRSLWGSFMFEVRGTSGKLSGADGGLRQNQARPQGAEEVGEARQTIYFGGDSAETSYWSEIGAMFPGIDVAMLGIGAYRPDFMMKENHANPEEAFGGYRSLGAKYWWPMHHGTYDLSNEPASEPIRWAERLMGEAGLANRLLQPAINAPYYLD